MAGGEGIPRTARGVEFLASGATPMSDTLIDVGDVGDVGEDAISPTVTWHSPREPECLSAKNTSTPSRAIGSLAIPLLKITRTR
jgi:hypothetical protein